MVLKKTLIEFCHLFFSFAIHNTTQAGKFCYQRTQNLCRRCRRFRQRVCECQDCLISPHYHTCQVSLDGGSSVITLLPLLLWGGWFCYQFRDFFLLFLFSLLLRVVVVDVVVYLFAFSWTRHTINTTPLRPRPSAMRRTGILGTTSDESPHLRLKPLQLLNLSQRHSLLPGGGPSGSTDLLPTWTPAIRTCSVHGSNNPEKSSRRQRQRVQDDPHA